MSGLQRTYIFVGRPGGAERLVTDVSQAVIYLRSALAKENPNYEYDLEDYVAQFAALLPRGPAWDSVNEGLLADLIYGIAAEYWRVSNQIVELENDTFPLNTTQLLPDWERVLGLPDSCYADAAQSTTERRAAVVTKLSTISEPSPEFFRRLALDFGYAIEIVEYSPAYSGRARSGDRINGNGYEFTWAVRIPGEYTQTRRALCGDTLCGDRIATWGQGSLECLIRQYKPAHTLLNFLYE